MKFSELLSNHPAVSIAHESDNKDILDFFDSIPMTGKGLELQYDRSPDFFAFLKIQSSDYFVFLLKNDGLIQGVGTLIVRDGYIDGSKTKVGYLGDLRVKHGKKNALLWRKFYQDLIQQAPLIEELKGARHFITAVIDSNTEAQTSLVKAKKNSFSYHKLVSYKMANLYLAMPLKGKAKFEIRKASANDKDLIDSYWETKERNKPFGYINKMNLSYEDIVLAFENEKIVGMCGLWSPYQFKRIILKRLPLGLKVFSHFLKLIKPSSPLEGEEIRPLYLSHLNFDSEDVLKDILQFVFRLPEMKDYHMLSVAIFNDEEERALKGFIKDKIPMSLYQVFDTNHPELKLNTGISPGFEMSLV